MSANGKYQIIAERDGVSGKMYISQDYGLTWTEIADIGATRWLSVEVSSSANYFVGQKEYRKAQKLGFDDIFLLDNSGHITELSVANIFVLKNGEWRTPPNNGSILPGFTRQWVIDETGAKEA